MAAMIYMRSGPYSSLPLYPLFREAEELLAAAPSSAGIKQSRRRNREGRKSKPSSEGQVRIENFSGKEEGSESLCSIPKAAGTLSGPVKNQPSAACNDSKPSVLASTQRFRSHGSEKDDGCSLEETSIISYGFSPPKKAVSNTGALYDGALSSGHLDKTLEDDEAHGRSQTPSCDKGNNTIASRFKIWREPGPSPLSETTLPTSGNPLIQDASPSGIADLNNNAEESQPSQTVWLIMRDSEMDHVDWIPFRCAFMHARAEYWKRHPGRFHANSIFRAPDTTGYDHQDSLKGTPGAKTWKPLGVPSSPFTFRVEDGSVIERAVFQGSGAAFYLENRNICPASPRRLGKCDGRALPNRYLLRCKAVESGETPEREISTDTEAAALLRRKRWELKETEGERRRKQAQDQEESS